ncbi:hypothetical protein HMPREF1544_09688 [Mucor circinelloides 1006PhL]|uniref:CCHC-type domain-containing protein n=1 Tax=Mucor circinelloides f. circinelloides (strain 1006PhL) TaxID=1220926 RepID=S2J0J9_MUCC1|nr:hypothetical protein HMPREF1544_09688 [Mucor circinelloides 1006PhL]
MSTTTDLTWAQRASRQTNVRFLQQNKRKLENNRNVPLVGTVLYEDDDLKGQILASKAMAIIQQPLSSGSVLFSFQKTLFSDRVAAYKLIQEQISTDAEFRPLSLYDSRDDGSLLIEAKFANVDHALKAMQEGVTVQVVVYKAFTSKESAEFGDLKHVQFTLLRMTQQATFLADLMESLSYYGKVVLQVKKFTHLGDFEGKLSVMLDTSVGYQVGELEYQEARPLGRMLYLSEFDCFVPATYKGAPPVCHFCQHSGHVRAKCPELARRKCFGYNKQGHMIKFCPEGESRKTADYLKKKKVHHQPEESMDITKARQLTTDVMDSLEKEKLGVGKKDEDENLDSDVDEDDSLQGDDKDESENDESGEQQQREEMDHQDEDDHTENQYEDMEEEEVLVAGSSSGSGFKGSAYSKYAPNSIAMTMQVDKRKEKMGLSTVRQTTQHRRAAFDAKLKQGSGGAGVSSFNRGVGTKDNKTGLSGVSGGGKLDGKLANKTKQDARRAQ